MYYYPSEAVGRKREELVKKTFRLTEDGIGELKTELTQLEGKRPDIAERIRVAREQGDLSENADYQIAKDDLSRVESRISEIQHILQHVELINDAHQSSTVGAGVTVKLRNGGGKTLTYKIVGSMEADPLKGKISDHSPLGKALIGKKQGDKAQIKTPTETTTYTIVNVS
jgi:transcription elongation factor GreA